MQAKTLEHLTKMKNLTEKCLEMTSLFEAELLVQLMLRYWKHPFADDKDFANGLLEGASGALRSASQGEELIEGVPPTKLNFVAAVWYTEHCAVETEEAASETIEARKTWLLVVRKTLPSCFCNPSDLP